MIAERALDLAAHARRQLLVALDRRRRQRLQQRAQMLGMAQVRRQQLRPFYRWQCGWWSTRHQHHRPPRRRRRCDRFLELRRRPLVDADDARLERRRAHLVLDVGAPAADDDHFDGRARLDVRVVELHVRQERRQPARPLDDHGAGAPRHRATQPVAAPDHGRLGAEHRAQRRARRARPEHHAERAGHVIGVQKRDGLGRIAVADRHDPRQPQRPRPRQRPDVGQRVARRHHEAEPTAPRQRRQRRIERRHLPMHVDEAEAARPQRPGERAQPHRRRIVGRPRRADPRRRIAGDGAAMQRQVARHALGRRAQPKLARRQQRVQRRVGRPARRPHQRPPRTRPSARSRAASAAASANRRGDGTGPLTGCGRKCLR